MKSLILVGVLAGLVGAPSVASAGWRGGGGHMGGGHGGFGGGGHGFHSAPVGRVGVGVHVGGPGVRFGVRPGFRANVWVPGYWGFRGGARLWFGGGWYAPPYDGWIWVAPQWAWNGYQWVWQEGHWAAPY
ncbi:MAG TPA: hypothetical protein VH374_20075 [Polyangia bacterium]|nr:hypothetical protein [Polyangia bacterium]